MPRVKIGLPAFAAGLVASAAVHAEPRTFVIDPDHFSVGFEATHIGYAQTLGLFLEGSGSFVFDEDTRELLEAEITINPDSVFTNHDARDNHLRGSDFLHTAENPVIRFVMTSATATSETTGTVEGDLTLRGQTHPISVKVTYNKADTYPFNDNYVIGVSASTVIRRSQWGMTYAIDNGLVGDLIPIRIELEAIRQ